MTSALAVDTGPMLPETPLPRNPDVTRCRGSFLSPGRCSNMTTLTMSAALSARGKKHAAAALVPEFAERARTP